MKYCSECAHEVTVKVPPQDSLPRFVCECCGAVFYENPKLVVGTLPLWENEILLCKRSIEPRLGYWTLPAGFLEKGETVQEGACRETVEEANANIQLERLFAVYSLPQISQVYMIFLARVQDLKFKPGEETLEVKLVSPEAIPWDRIAFRAIEFALEKFVDSGSDQASVHLGEYDRKRNGRWIRRET